MTDTVNVRSQRTRRLCGVPNPPVIHRTVLGAKRVVDDEAALLDRSGVKVRTFWLDGENNRG